MEETPVENNNTSPKDLNGNPDLDTPQTILKRKTEENPPEVSPKKQKSDPIPMSKPHSSPKKKITVPEAKPKFIYGNYSRYYGYRNTKDFHDVRLDVFEAQKELFEGKEILDIGCNSGFVTMEIAKKFNPAHITGIDIDNSLISRLKKFIGNAKKTSTSDTREGFPFNMSVVRGNYVLLDDVLLEIEQPQFDLILCLSVTKWIHLNFGDSALKQAFRRMYLQLRDGGKLILEAQPWEGYKRRKKLTATILKNYQEITFKPKDFTDYLLSSEVGFKTVELLAVPDHCAEGFRRPIQIFSK